MKSKLALWKVNNHYTYNYILADQRCWRNSLYETSIYPLCNKQHILHIFVPGVNILYQNMFSMLIFVFNKYLNWTLTWMSCRFIWRIQCVLEDQLHCLTIYPYNYTLSSHTYCSYCIYSIFHSALVLNVLPLK